MTTVRRLDRNDLMTSVVFPHSFAGTEHPDSELQLESGQAITRYRIGSVVRRGIISTSEPGDGPVVSEFYKTATLTGTAPAGHPVMLQAHQYQPEIAGLGAATVLATNVGANQGIAASTNHYFTTGGLNADPDNSCIIRVWGLDWGASNAGNPLFQYDIREWVAAGVTQANGMQFVEATNKLYVSTMNYPTTPKVSQILEFDYNPATGVLTYVAQHDVGDIHSEGVSFYDDHFWIVGTDKYEIWRFDLTWTAAGQYPLPGAAPTVSGTDLYQDIEWIGKVAICNLHNNNPNAPRADSFYWTGTDTGFVASEQVFPPAYCGQGLHLTPDRSAMLWARRTNDDSTTGDDVISTPLISPATGVSLEGKALPDFSDVRITTADGLTTLAGDGHGWLETVIINKTAFFHFALPAALVETMDFRIYYGSGIAGAASIDSSSVTLNLNDFESGRDSFPNNYNTGNATSSVGTGLDGTASLSVTSVGTGDGVYSNDNDFMQQGLRKLSGWVKPKSGQATTLPSVYFMQRVTGTTMRRGALQFNGQSVFALDNGVTSAAAFASRMGLDKWIRFEILFDYANAKYGAKVWDENGVLRGEMPMTTWTLDNGTRAYTDVLLFRTMLADRFFSQELLPTEPSWGTWSDQLAA